MAFLDTFQRAHVIGAGGIGVSAVAKLLVHEGKTVTGSDVAANETTRELEAAGVAVAIGHDAKNVPPDADLVVYSGAVPPTNPEREEAKRRGIRELKYPEFLGEFSKERWTIAVSGTNGKSTTTALLGLMLERGGLDPTVIVGSKVRAFPDKNLRKGRGTHFVIEACEHEANMLHLHPQMIVLTNVEEDHLDFYRDIGHIRDTFQRYIDKLPPDGTLVVNADDHVSFFELKPKTAFVSYGIDNPADYVARHVEAGPGMQSFDILRTVGHEELVGNFMMRIPGRFNVANALAAATAALELGVTPEAIRDTLRDFPGIWRRFERVGERRGAVIISDYGHHPSAIRGTLEAAAEFYPDRRIVLAFQPHQHNRTKKLFNEFVASFDAADVLVLAKIFDVTGREGSDRVGEVASADQQVSARGLVEAVRSRDSDRGVRRELLYADSLEEVRTTLEGLVQPNDVVIIMGAGDIYRVAKWLSGLVAE